jgi:predicted NAD-dependent protein-ADP-ribosyltransferase YbiA (DUF1768 family)
MAQTQQEIERMRNMLEVMQGMSDLIPHFPTVLDEPRIYLSTAQTDICRRNPLLSHLVLPGWVKLRLIADALGHAHTGIDNALSCTGQLPWLWATEFENVHTTWRFNEPTLTIDGVSYPDCETYYKSKQNPVHSAANAAAWDLIKVGVMTKAITAKFEASPEAKRLLISTHPFPLLSIKDDAFWGFHPVRGGQNMLAQLLMALRKRYVDGTFYRSNYNR